MRLTRGIDGSYYEADYRLKRKDGRWIWAHDRGEVTDRDEMGHPLRMLEIIQGVTKFWQSQEAITEASQIAAAHPAAELRVFIKNKKINFLSSVTRHDILNQIVGLSECVELMRKNLPEDCAAMQEYIDRATEMTDKIHRQVVFTRDYQDSENRFQSTNPAMDNSLSPRGRTFSLYSCMMEKSIQVLMKENL